MYREPTIEQWRNRRRARLVFLTASFLVFCFLCCLCANSWAAEDIAEGGTACVPACAFLVCFFPAFAIFLYLMLKPPYGRYYPYRQEEVKDARDEMFMPREVQEVEQSAETTDDQPTIKIKVYKHRGNR